MSTSPAQQNAEQLYNDFRDALAQDKDLARARATLGADAFAAAQSTGRMQHFEEIADEAAQPRARGDADDHAEHGQGRAHFVARQRLQSDSRRHHRRHRLILESEI